MMQRPVTLAFLLLQLTAIAWSAPDIVLLGPFGGDVRSLAIHPQRPETVFLGTADGQIFVSRDSGARWQRLEPGLGRRAVVVDNLVFHPHDPDVLYAASWELLSSSGWLARTTDGGKTWENLPLGSYSSQIRALAVAPTDPNVVAVGVSEGVLLSLDSGMTWKLITAGQLGLQNIESLAFDPNDSQTLYAGTWRLSWKTKDRGQSWTPIHKGMYYDSHMFSIVVNPANPEVIFSSACSGIYRSANGGRLWNKLTNGLPSEAKRTRFLQLDPADPDLIYAGTTIGLFVSSDSGASWQQLVADVVVNAVAVKPDDPNLILVGTDDAGVLRSSDGGKSFSPANEGFIHRQISALGISQPDPNLIFAAVGQDGEHGGVFVSHDRGRLWRRHNEGLQGLAAGVRTILVGSRDNTVFLGTKKGVFVGNDTIPWEQIESTKGLRILHLDFADGEERQLLLATESGLYQLDTASRKTVRVKLSDYEGPVYRVHRDRQQGHLLAATLRGIFHQVPGPASWTLRAQGLPPLRVNFIRRVGNQLFVGTRKGLFSAPVEGDQWRLCENVFLLDIVDLSVDPEDPDHLVAADSTGGFLFQSRDGGITWKAYPPENRSRITKLRFTGAGELLAATLSEGVYRLTMPALPGAQ